MPAVGGLTGCSEPHWRGLHSAAPPSLDTGVEAGFEGSDVLGLPRDGAEAGTTGAEPR
jgi:hypothetical protein